MPWWHHRCIAWIIIVAWPTGGITKVTGQAAGMTFLGASLQQAAGPIADILWLKGSLHITQFDPDLLGSAQRKLSPLLPRQQRYTHDDCFLSYWTPLLDAFDTGDKIHAALEAFPRLGLSASLHPITRGVARIQLTITPEFVWKVCCIC